MKKATVKLFEKADQAIQASSRELKAGDVDTSVSRAYYAMFYVAGRLCCLKKGSPLRNTVPSMQRLVST